MDLPTEVVDVLEQMEREVKRGRDEISALSR